MHSYPPPSTAPSTSAVPPAAETREEVKSRLAQLVDDSSSWWAWFTAGWLVTLAFPLLAFPRFFLFLSIPAGPATTEMRETLYPLERFLCTHLGIGLIATALALVTSIPSPPPLVRSGLAPTPTSGHPLLGPLSLGLSLTAFVAYNTANIGALGTLISVGSGITGVWGLWVMAFEGTSNYSNKTGADKHTSSFLFGNRAAASEQKKLWKHERERELAEKERAR